MTRCPVFRMLPPVSHAPIATPGTTFAELLRGFRERAGLTQEELAGRAGLTPHAVSALERGARSRPYPHTVRSLAGALQLDDGDRARLQSSVPRRGAPRPDPAAGETSGRGDAPALALGMLPSPPLSGPSPAAVLGAPTTALLGREEDQDAVVRLVRSGARFVTLTGPGGVGKTRLVAAVAETLAGDHADGVVTVPLAAVTDAHALVPQIARALGVAGGDGPEVQTAIEQFLTPLRVLLVLDNLEQLLGAAPHVASLVAAAPGVHVLATSRSPLRVRGEQEYAVEPLALPPVDVSNACDLAGSAAGALVLDRVRAIDPRLEVDDESARHLAEVCRRLAGLPLAIELASSRLRVLQPADLLRRLGDLDASGAARDLPERQRTMRATLDWSYGLLSDDERRLFRLLGAFRGGAGLAAVEAVLEGVGARAADAVDLLGSLVEQSMVVSRSGPGGEARFVQLEPIAQYARGRLVGDEAEAAYAAHARHFCEMAETAELGYERADQVAWLARVDADEANILAAIDRSTAVGDHATAARISWSMWLYWWLRGQVVVGRAKAESCLAGDLPPALEGRAHLAAATMSYAGGDEEACSRHWDQALEIAGRDDDRELAQKALSGTALAAMSRGDLDLAEERLLRSIDVGPGNGRTWMDSLSWVWLGTCHMLRGRHPEAGEAIDRGLELARERGDRLATYIALYNLAQAAILAGDPESARSHLEEGVSLSQETRDVSNLAYFLEALAVVESMAVRPRRVGVLLGAAASLRESAGANVYRYYQPDETMLTAAELSAREALGDDAFDDEVDLGRGLDVDEAVALALDRPAA
jgi:predicted ATPase/transcriptional regulator with XRE-family HTH domain